MNVIRTPAGKLRRRAAIGVVGLAALGGGGAAVAASKDSSTSPQAQSAITSDAASQLGVTSTALTAAIKKAMVDQIEAQVTAGTITKAQATTMEARLAQADAPLFALGGGKGDHGRGVRGAGGGPVSFDAAATYIGVTTTELRTQLAAGTTLAAIATANGKTVDGLKAALTTAATKDLDAAVTAGRLTAAQETTILADLPTHLDQEINDAHTGGPGGPGGHDGFGGPPPAAASSTAPAA
jgi:hypothetical protein